MNTTNTGRIKNIVLTLLLALALVVSFALTALADSDILPTAETQQDRIIAHAMEHKNQKFKQIKDRNEGLKIKAGTPWCAWFIEHCAYQCDLGDIIPTKSKADLAVGTLAEDLVNNKKATITFVNKKLWSKIKGDFNKNRRSYDKSYQPRKGDIILYTDYQISGSYRLSHVGFVYEDCENALKGVKTIEGNTLASNENKWETTSKVGVRSRAGDTHKERRIAAYITPNYSPQEIIIDDDNISVDIQ